MRAVDVGICHEHDLVVAELFEVAFVVADAASDGGDQRLDLLVLEDAVRARLFHVQELASDRDDRLVLAVAAALGGTACGLTFDDEEFADLRVVGFAVGELAGEGEPFEGALALDFLAGAARGFTGAGRHDRLLDDLAGDVRVFLEEGGEAFADDGVHDALDFAVAELGLGLAFELGIRDLAADNGGEPFLHVLAGHGLVALDEALRLRVVVHGARERGLEPGHVGAALARADVVRVAEDVFLELGVVLHGDLDVDAVALLVHVDHVLMHQLLVRVQHLHELDDAALVVERFGADRGLAFVGEVDADAAVQEGELAEAFREDVPDVFGRLGEDGRVGLERHGRAAVGHRMQRMQLHGGVAALEPDLVRHAVAVDFDRHPGGKGVHAGDADAVEAAGHLVGVVVELAAGVQHGHHDFDGRDAEFLVDVDRDAASVVADADAVVREDGHGDLRGESGERFVDTVVDDFVDQVVQAALGRVADVHAGTLADGFQAVEDGDLVRGIVVRIAVFGLRREFAVHAGFVVDGARRLRLPGLPGFRGGLRCCGCGLRRCGRGILRGGFRCLGGDFVFGHWILHEVRRARSAGRGFCFFDSLSL